MSRRGSTGWNGLELRFLRMPGDFVVFGIWLGMRLIGGGEGG